VDAAEETTEEAAEVNELVDAGGTKATKEAAEVEGLFDVGTATFLR
jgi:hypothetical protein